MITDTKFSIIRLRLLLSTYCLSIPSMYDSILTMEWRLSPFSVYG
jgi:hypothetical protein